LVSLEFKLKKIYNTCKFYFCMFNFGLNIFLVLIFVVFIANDPHFDRMFKMVFMFAIRVLFGHFLVTSFESLTEHCTGGTVWIRVYYVYYTGVMIRYLRINKWARVLVRNVWAVGEFWQSCFSIPNWCCCNLLLPTIPLYRYVTVPIFFLYLWL